jgi:transposase
LWAITSPKTDSNSAQTLYHVNKSRGSKVILRLLGKAFGGTLVSDFYSAYSKMPCRKQKCLAHLLRELNQTAEKSQAFASGNFLAESKRLLKQMLRLKCRWDQLDQQEYLSRVARLEDQLKSLALGQYDEPHARRIAKRMKKHLGELTAFLREKDLDPTNNAAERAIRPAVVMRKISGGSRSKSGANAWATLGSLLRTADQEGKNLLQTIKSMLTAAWASEKPPTFTAGP